MTVKPANEKFSTVWSKSNVRLSVALLKCGDYKRQTGRGSNGPVVGGEAAREWEARRVAVRATTCFEERISRVSIALSSRESWEVSTYLYTFHSSSPGDRPLREHAFRCLWLGPTFSSCSSYVIACLIREQWQAIHGLV